MKQIDIYLEDTLSKNADSPELALHMDGLTSHQIDNEPWPTFTHNYNSKFSIAHSNEAIYVKYYVQEGFLNIAPREINGPVHRDNCVEFFISFDDDSEYYNLEFNCFGVAKVAYGKSRAERSFLPEETIKRIDTYTLIKWSPKPDNALLSWELTLVIPKDVFCYHHLASFSGLKCKANFYKCGEDLPDPYFLSWNMIEAEKPDFHRPEYFGSLNFC